MKRSDVVRRGGRSGRRVGSLFAAIGLMGLVSSTRGDSGTWTNTAGGTWSTDTNWKDKIIADGAGDTGNFSTINLTTSNKTVTIDTTPRKLGTLLIGDTVSSSENRAYVINATGGGTLTFDNGMSAAVINQIATTAGDTISAPVILNSSLDITNAATSSTGDIFTISSGGISAGTAGTKTISILGTTAGGVTLSAPISNGGAEGVIAIAKGNANNTLILSGTNTFTGGVALSAGTLSINSTTALGATASTLTITGGTVQAGSAITLANNNAQNWSGNFAFGGGSSLNFGTGAVTLAGNAQVTLSTTGTFTVGGAIGDGGNAFSLTTANAANGPTATGVLALGGANTYTGGTNVNGGLVRFTTAAALPATGTLTIGSGGAVAVAGPNTTIAGWLNDARLATASTGALALTGTGATISDDFNPGTTGHGTLSLGAAFGSTVTYDGDYAPVNNAYLVGGGGGSITFSNTNAFTGARTLTAGNGGGGTVILSANNDYTGATTIAAGTLQVGAGGTTGSLGTTPSVTINAGTIAFNRSDNVTFNAPITGAGGLTKLGAGTLTLGGANNLTGTTRISNGTIQSGVDNAIPRGDLNIGSGTTAGHLNLGNFSQTAGVLSFLSTSSSVTNTVTIAPGKTLATTGLNVNPSGTGGVTTNVTLTGGGTLSVTDTAATISIGMSGSSNNRFNVDMSGLGSFKTNVGTFNVGFDDINGGTVLLSDTSNEIIATTLQIAHSNGANAQSSTVTLGAGSNALKVTTLNLSFSKATGTLKFASQEPGSPGSVSITGKTGGASTANITIASKGNTSTGTSLTGTLDLRGHQATVQAGTVVVGSDASGNGTGNSNATGVIHFDQGTFSVATLQLANKSGSSTGTTTGTFNVGGGAVTVTTALRLGLHSSGGAAVANLNITGGSLTSNVNITDGGGTTTSSLTLDGGTLNLTNHSIGTATTLIDTLNFRSGTLQNVSQINNGAGLVKSAGTAGNTLVLSGTNTYTGGTTIDAGTLLANSAAPASSTGTGPVTVNTGGTLGGTGRIGNTAGVVTVNGGGTVAPGESVGTLSIAGPLTFAAAGESGPATYAAELKADGTSDLLALTGTGSDGLLTIGSGSALDLLALENITGPTTYTIASFASETGQFTSVLANGQPTQPDNIALPNYAKVDYTTDSTKIFVTVANLTAVPEPATAGVVALAAIGLLARRRRRQRRA